MSVTTQLLDVFRVDKQLRGLRSRLDGAERFLTQQSVLLAELEKTKTTLETQIKGLRATIANEEGEAARIEARATSLRDQMNNAKTAKEYGVFQSELNTLKDQKTAADEKVLESMGKVEEADKKLADITAQHTDRAKIAHTAKADRDTKAAEIKDRLAELTEQRKSLAATVPAREMKMLEDLIRSRGDEAMAPIEVLDRRAHEGNCSACMMAVTVEVVSSLMSGKLVSCPACHCILYMEESAFAKEKKTKDPSLAALQKKQKKAKADAQAKEEAAT
jgi:predicted  nucleic acid-binding Zn-ribbon protein